MVERNMVPVIEKMGVDPNNLRLLLQHGRRQGYLSLHDILDCIPEAEHDETLYQYILQAAADEGIEFINDESVRGITRDTLQDYENQLSSEVEEEDALPEDALESVADISDVETNDMVKMYIREAAHVPLLKSEQEVDLAQQIELGKMAQDELKRGNVGASRKKELHRMVEAGKAAREHLIRANARLVISVAKKYIGRGLPFLDLIQEGNIGLMRGIRNFDYHRGYKFSTYATWWIRQAISRALAEQSRTIRLPVYMSDQVNRMVRVQSQLHQQLGRLPDVEELSQALEVPPAKVQQLLEVVKQPLSLQTPMGEDEDEELGNLIEDTSAINPEEATTELLMNESLQEMLESLPPREKMVLQMRYGLTGDEPLTLNEIGRRMGITRERARQLETQALNRLRGPSAGGA